MNSKWIVAFSLLIVLTVVWSFAAGTPAVTALDHRVNDAAEGLASPLTVALSQMISQVGREIVAPALAILVAVLFALFRSWPESIGAIAILGGSLLGLVVKALSGRARPHPGPNAGLSVNNGLMTRIASYSYPSGHVLFVTVFVGFLGYLAWRHLRGTARWALVTFGAFLIVLVGPARIILHEHWLSDVIGGYLIGAVWLLVLIPGYEWGRRKLAKRSDVPVPSA